jgi:uncharacterized protein YciI
MTGCSFCLVGRPPMVPMGGAPSAAAVERSDRTPLPFGFGVLIDPDGFPTTPTGPSVPKGFVDPEDAQFKPIIGPTGPRMFLVTFSDPSPVLMEPPPPEVEEAHVTRLAELYRAGRLHFVGHQTNGKEGFMLLSANDLQEAWATAQDDPLIRSGYFRSVDLKEIEGPYPWTRYGPRELRA